MLETLDKKAFEKGTMILDALLNQIDEDNWLSGSWGQTWMNDGTRLDSGWSTATTTHRCLAGAARWAGWLFLLNNEPTITEAPETDRDHVVTSSVEYLNAVVRLNRAIDLVRPGFNEAVDLPNWSDDRVVAFNDTISTTFEDVRMVIKQARELTPQDLS